MGLGLRSFRHGQPPVWRLWKEIRTTFPPMMAPHKAPQGSDLMSYARLFVESTYLHLLKHCYIFVNYQHIIGVDSSTCPMSLTVEPQLSSHGSVHTWKIVTIKLFSKIDMGAFTFYCGGSVKFKMYHFAAEMFSFMSQTNNRWTKREELCGHPLFIHRLIQLCAVSPLSGGYMRCKKIYKNNIFSFNCCSSEVLFALESLHRSQSHVTKKKLKYPNIIILFCFEKLDLRWSCTRLNYLAF